MGIVDLVADIFRRNLGQDVVDMLRLYEDTYPPDWGVELAEGSPSLFDFITVGGDIATVGFWYNATLDSVIALATQDLLLRMLINDSMSRFMSEFGIGPIEDLPRDTMEAAVALAAAQSPYIAEVISILVVETATDTINIRVEAITPTGDQVGLGLNLGGASS